MFRIFIVILALFSFLSIAKVTITDSTQSMYKHSGVLKGKRREQVDPTTLPLATWEDSFAYAGAFKTPYTDGATASYSAGIIGFSANQGNFYMVDGPSVAISEYTIPALSLSSDENTINSAVLVNKSLNFANAPTGNLEGKNMVGGLYVHNGSLLATVIQQYDADANNEYVLARASNPTDFTNPQLGGYYRLDNKYKASGWISEVPLEWQGSLGYEHIIGNADNWSIIGRSSVGPSMYGIDLNQLTATTPVDPIQSRALLSYDLQAGQQLQQQVNPAWNLENTSLNNDLWTFTSVASFGFIVPNTRTYAVFGHSSGHTSGVGYKITTNQGRVCAGYCTQDEEDWSHYVWFFDLNDILQVKSGVKQPYEVTPYEYHAISTPYSLAQGATKLLPQRGGMFDAANGRLYLTLGNAYVPGGVPRPIIVAYDVGVQ